MPNNNQLNQYGQSKIIELKPALLVTLPQE